MPLIYVYCTWARSRLRVRLRAGLPDRVESSSLLHAFEQIANECTVLEMSVQLQLPLRGAQ